MTRTLPYRAWLQTAASFARTIPLLPICVFWLLASGRVVHLVGGHRPVDRGGAGNLSNFVAPIEKLRRTLAAQTLGVERELVLNLSSDDNRAVRQLYDDHFRIVGDESRYLREILWWTSRIVRRQRLWSEDKSSAVWCTKSVLQLNQNAVSRGMRYLESVGLDERQPFICVTTRSESYYQRRIAEGARVRPQSLRNPEEETYLRVASQIAEARGLAVFRIGRDLPPLDTNVSHLRVIDYAGQSRSDDLDLFLMSRAKMLLNGATGAFWLGTPFGTRQFNGDIYDARHVTLDGDIFALQLVQRETSNEFLTLAEMIRLRGEYNKEGYSRRLGVRMVKNSETELLECAGEMLDRIDGSWDDTERDYALRHSYLETVRRESRQPTWIGAGFPAASFLRRNWQLLDL